jgi:hypothetical protein
MNVELEGYGLGVVPMKNRDPGFTLQVLDPMKDRDSGLSTAIPNATSWF